MTGMRGGENRDRYLHLQIGVLAGDVDCSNRLSVASPQYRHLVRGLGMEDSVGFLFRVGMAVFAQGSVLSVVP